MDGKRWLRRFLCAAAALLALLALICYIVDPFMQYRVRDNTYYINARFACPGILKNGDYDAVVIGSSLVQNFNMQSFRDKLGVNAVKATEGGLSHIEMLELTELINRADRAETYYICISINAFAEEEDHAQRSFPSYLMNDSLLDDYRYLLGYEAWMRYLPVDLALLACDALGIALPDAVNEQRSIDKMEDFSRKYPCGAQYLIEDFPGVSHKPFDAVSSQRSQDALNGQIHRFFDRLPLREDKEYVFFFPPLSMLYWHSFKPSYTDAMNQCKRTVVQRLSGYDNVTVYDFQCMPETADLDNYMDVSHYSPEINEKMIDCFASGEYTVTAETIGESIGRQQALIEAFYAENAEWMD